MPLNRPYVLSIAGFDPSAGAGILADIKTLEQLQVYGLAICSAITYQHESEFKGLHWIKLSQLKEQIDILLKKYPITYIKIGLVKDIDTLHHLIDYLKLRVANARIIWDPILKSSSGFGFHKAIDPDILEHTCKKLFLLTPNLHEASQLGGNEDPEQSALKLSKYCPVLLKGGHSVDTQSNDILFMGGGKTIFRSEKMNELNKHGTGCVLSSAIAANLAKGKTLEEACYEAKGYINNFIRSTNGLLGYHN